MIEGMDERIIAACDGASKGNPGPAAWAWVVADAQGQPYRWEAGPLGSATNNVAELTALRELLESTDPAVPTEVRMDSQYAMNAVTKWLRGWKRNGWKTSTGKPVANRDLVMAIDALLEGRSVSFHYVPAHHVGGDLLNALADQAASEVAVTQKAAAGAKLPIKFGKTDAVIVGSAPGSVPTALDPNPKANLKFDMGTSTAANIFLGGTVTPAGNQAPGSYVATVVLTVTIQ